MGARGTASSSDGVGQSQRTETVSQRARAIELMIFSLFVISQCFCLLEAEKWKSGKPFVAAELVGQAYAF